ncbi:MAG: nicotinate phosphoribosyltransferase [Acidobacteriota bacterium]
MRPSQFYRRRPSLLTDLYQLTMASAFVSSGRSERRAVYHLTFRRAPFGGSWMAVCGLGPLLEAVDTLAFDTDDLEYVASLEGAEGRPLFGPEFLRWLEGFRFEGAIDAMPEGSIGFPGEPVLRVEGGLAECQMLETLMLNQVNYASAIATKAARVCHVAAEGEPVLEFGLRRAPGIGGGVAASRAAWIGGCRATSNLMAGRVVDIPVRGTHAHSWVMAFEDEIEAFRAYARAMPHNSVLLVDTYDTQRGVERAIQVAREMRAEGAELGGLRLDSGDLLELSLWAREKLDTEGFPEVRIVASGGLDELTVAALRRAGAPIDVWGVGTRIVAAGDGIDGVYKLSLLESDDGRWLRRMKATDDPRKASLPGRLQVGRVSDDGSMCNDTLYDLSLPGADEVGGQPLLEPFVRDGEVLSMPEEREARDRLKSEVDRLPEEVRSLENPQPFPVRLHPELEESVERARAALDDDGAG